MTKCPPVGANLLRRLALTRQGLLTAAPFGRGIEATLKIFARLGYVQIDTISVVERAHHHVLWSRNTSYRPDQLQQLIRQRAVFEYWYHAASYLPMTDFRFALPRMRAIKSGAIRYFPDLSPALLKEVRARIRLDGPLRVRDFQSTREKDRTWWNWSDHKRAIDKLFMQGDLMVSERNGFEKVFDLTERVVPTGISMRVPTLTEYAEHLVDRALDAHGFVTVKQVAYLRRGAELRRAIAKALDSRLDAGRTFKMMLNGKSTVYVLVNELKQPRKSSTAVRMLSPFDNFLIFRDRLTDLFQFNYRLECYVPRAKRRFGYFCLPVLFGEELVGRVDCKAHREAQHFEVIGLFLESRAIDISVFAPNFAKAAHEFASFNGCTRVSITRANPATIAAPIRRSLKEAGEYAAVA